MSRWKAAGIHLLISIAIGLAVLALLFGVWFPAPYFDAAGGQHLLLVLLGVDVVLGPLLTLILFRTGKKGLHFDLGMIALLQVSALAYGLHVIAEARPVFIVAVVDRFNVVSASDVDDADLALGNAPAFRSRSWTGPRLAAVRLPSDPRERSDLLFSGFSGKDVEAFPRLYVEYASEAPGILLRAKSIGELRKQGAQFEAVIDSWLERTGTMESSVVWVPVMARRASLTMLLDAQSGAVLDAIAIDPW